MSPVNPEKKLMQNITIHFYALRTDKIQMKTTAGESEKN